MIRFKMVLQFIILLGTLNHVDQAMAETECLSRSLIAEVQRDFKFEGDARLNHCDPNNVVFQMIKAIQFIKGINGGGVTTGPFALNALKDDPFEYFKKRVDTIIFVDHDEECSVNTIAYVYPPSFESERRRMYVCSKNFPKISVADRVITLAHEARHFDGFDHVECVRGPLRFGSYACDRSYKEGGSYAIGVALYLRIAQNSALSPVLRRSAKMEATGDLTFRFNSLPADLQDGALLTNKSKLVSFFDGKSSQAVLQLNKNQSLHYVAGKNISPRIVEPGAELELTHGLTAPSRVEDSNRKSMIGSASSEDNFYALYEKNLFVYSYKNSQKALIDFSQIKPLSIFERVGSDGTLEVIMTDRDGRYTVLPKDLDQLQSLRESDLQMENNAAKILKMQTWQTQDKDITLTLDGRLRFFDRTRESYTPILPGTTYLDVVAPVVWSKSLQDL